MCKTVRGPGEEEISREILAYLSDHPDAGDSLEGIVEWWLLERNIMRQKKAVLEALNSLVEQGWVLRYSDKNNKILYHINTKKNAGQP